MKKLAFLSGMTLTTAAAAAEETAVHQPEFWMQVQEHVVNNDIPQLLGYASNPAYTKTYLPEGVSEGYLSFVQSAATIGNVIFMSVVLVAILFTIFVIFNGRAKLENGFSGKLINRWSPLDVALHWLAAIPCLILILSGLVIGAGRFWLEPLMSPTHFASFVDASVMFHNFFACLGGYINFGGKAKHPDAGFANAGEKAYFWTVFIFGLALIVTGLMMLYPDLFGGVDKNGALLALIIHIISAVVLGAFTVIHIFMGAVMSEGGMQNMINGKCDENWAKQNHNLWYAKVSK